MNSFPYFKSTIQRMEKQEGGNILHTSRSNQSVLTKTDLPFVLKTKDAGKKYLF